MIQSSTEAPISSCEEVALPQEINPEEAVIRYRGLILRTARDFHKRLSPGSVLLEDLVSECWVALLQSSSRWDPAYGVPFEFFIRPRLIGSMTDFMRSTDTVPRTTRDIEKRVRKTREELESEAGRHVSDDEVAGALNIDPTLLSNVLANVSNFAMLSLNVSPENNSWESILVDSSNPQPSDFLEQKESYTFVRSCLSYLPDVERSVIEMRYFIGMRSMDIADILGVSPSRITQITTKALSRLRVHLKNIVSDTQNISVE